MSSLPLFSPRRPLLPRVLAALAADRVPESEEYYAAALASGYIHWSIHSGQAHPESSFRPYWESWRPADYGTMAEAEVRHDSPEAAWRDLLREGVLPATWSTNERAFIHQWGCLRCGACTRDMTQFLELGLLSGGYACGACRVSELQVLRVGATPRSILDCAIFASDPEGLAEAERIARTLEGGPSARVAWRVAAPEMILHRLQAYGQIERQSALLTLGYAIDPIALWEDGIVLVAPWLAG